MRYRLFRGERVAERRGAAGTRAALFSAQIVSLCEEVHPLTVKPVFLRLEVRNAHMQHILVRACVHIHVHVLST